MARSLTPRWLDRLVIAAFVAALLAPNIDVFARPASVRMPELYELRRAAPLPALDGTLASFTAFPELYDEYFNDRFGLRDELIRGHSIVYLFGCGVSPRRDLLVGRDTWMFYSAYRTIDVSRGALPFEPNGLEAWVDAIQTQRDAVARLGADYLFVIAPNKETIYPQYLPRGMNRVGPSRYDQVLEQLRAHTDVPVLDLRAALRAATAADTPDDYLYYPHGSHWYGRGAHIAYTLIVERLAGSFPGLAPLPLSELEAFEGPADSWGDNAYIPDLLPRYSRCFRPAAPRARFRGNRNGGPQHDLSSTIDDPRLPRVMFVEDSMGAYLQDLLAEHCSSFVTRWSNDLDLAVVREHHPDVVIALHVERVFQGDPTRTLRGEPRPEIQFERASRTLFELDPAGPLDVFRAEGAPALTRITDERGPAVAVVLGSRSDSVILPHFEPPPDGNVLVEVVLETEVAQSAAVWFKRAETPRYGRAGRVLRKLEPGSNRLVFELAVPRLSGDLRLRAGLNDSQFVIRSFRVRAP